MQESQKELNQPLVNYEEDDDLIGLITSNADASGQYVIFRNAKDKLYAINVAKVEELIACSEIDISESSNKNSLIFGVAKVRGNVIPIIIFDKWLGDYDNSCEYELVMICQYGGERLGIIIKNVLGILSIDSKTMIDNSDKDDKTSFITEITLGGVRGLCFVFDSDKLLLEVFPKIEQNESAKKDNLTMNRKLKGKLLSADDSMVIRTALGNVYDKLGIDYEMFKDGALLLKRLFELPPETVSIIVTDLEMPVMDGIKLIEAIKENSIYSDIPIVVNTNMANGSVSEKCYGLGVNYIISKLDVEELSNTIKKYAR